MLTKRTVEGLSQGGWAWDDRVVGFGIPVPAASEDSTAASTSPVTFGLPSTFPFALARARPA